METWDIALLVAAGYVATVSLVRLMIRRRDKMLAEFRGQIEKEKARKDVEHGRSPRSGRRRSA